MNSHKFDMDFISHYVLLKLVLFLNLKRWLLAARAEDTASIKCRWILPSDIEEIPAGEIANEIIQQPEKHCFLLSGQAYQ